MSAQKDNEAPRRPGRPRGQKSGPANREQLMDIALALFARHGFARISLNAIAKEAGVTPAMLHYYFSSREALVEKLIEERFMPLRTRLPYNAHRASLTCVLSSMPNRDAAPKTANGAHNLPITIPKPKSTTCSPQKSASNRRNTMSGKTSTVSPSSPAAENLLPGK